MRQSLQSDFVKINKISRNKIVGFISGNFNILHPGHLRLIQFARECCGFLVIGVTPDNTPGVHVKQALRVESVLGLRDVDFVLPMNISVQEIISKIKPSFVFKGKEHESKQNIEELAVAAYGGKILFSSGEVRFNSLDLLVTENKDYFKVNKSYAVGKLPYKDQDLSKKVAMLLSKFESLRVAVIGDLILDEYINCESLGLSREDPTIVVSPLSSKVFVGGAGIVALHAGSLGAKVDFYSVIGVEKKYKSLLNKSFKAHKVAAHIFEDDTRPTTLKKRYRVDQKTLLRVSEIRSHDISQEIAEKILSSLTSEVNNYDLIIFSDFSYGCLPKYLVKKIIKFFKNKKTIIAADSQSSSQIGDISKFNSVDLITPTEYEARLALKDHTSGLSHLAQLIAKEFDVKNIALTLGPSGVLLQDHNLNVEQIGALNTRPLDVSGAGDSFLATCALSLACGESLWDSGLLGSIAAAIQVSRAGNVPISKKELLESLI